jgi:hypothetical protein
MHPAAFAKATVFVNCPTKARHFNPVNSYNVKYTTDKAFSASFLCIQKK